MLLSRTNTNFRIFFLSLPLLVLAFYQEWLDYFRLWYTSYVYSHGFLVLGGSAYLLYQRRNDFARLSISFYWPYFLALAGLVAVFLLAHSANIKLVRMLLLPMLLVAWGMTLWGRPFAKVAGVPIMLLIFGAPFWDEMSPALQWLTVLVDEKALALISIPAEIDEFYITIPSGIFHVDTGCSGIRYLLVALYLATFYGCMTHSGLRKTASFIAIAAFLALLSNWIRVAWIIVAGHYTNMESSLVDDHEMFGWIVFVVVVLVPFLAITHYVDKKNPTTSSTEPNTPREAVNHNSANRKPILGATLPIVFIPAFLLLQNQIADATTESWKPALPTVRSETWTGPIQHADFWSPRYHAHDIHLSGVYVNDQREQVQLDFFGYFRQVQGKELVYYKNSVFDREFWQPIERTAVRASIPNAWGLEEVNQLSLEHKGTNQKAVVWFWHDIGGSTITSRAEVQVIAGIKTLIGDPRAGIWILSTECQDTDLAQCQKAADKRLRSFVSKNSAGQQ